MGGSRPRWRTLTILLAVVLISALLPGVAAGQAGPLDDSLRRVILVPGIIFGQPIGAASDQGEINACYRAIEQTFARIYATLTSLDQRRKLIGEDVGWKQLLTLLPAYQPSQIYAFDYAPKDRSNEPCVRYDPQGDNQNDADDIIHGPLPAGGDIASNRNSYIGTDTRTRLISSIPEEERSDWWQAPWNPFNPSPAYAPSAELRGTPERFALQFRQWRAACPNCHFDIIAHSLGGAVVAYAIAAYTNADDRAHIHSVSTIDSPVNGFKADFIDFHPLFIKGFEAFNKAGGLPPVDLKDLDFVSTMRRAPELVDMQCISNLYDALIPPQAALIRSWGATDLLYGGMELDAWFNHILGSNAMPSYPGACNNVIGRFSKANPYDIRNMRLVLDQLPAAHLDPLAHKQVQLLVLQQIAHDPVLWTQRQPTLRAWLERPVRSRLTTPNSSTTVEITLRNTGTAVWEPGKVTLEFIDGENFGLARSQPIDRVVKPNETIALTLKFNAPSERGTYPSRWRLSHGTYRFGQEIIFGLVVLPSSAIDPNQALDDPVTVLRAIVNQFVVSTRERLQNEIDKLIAELQRQAVEQFWRAVCGIAPAMVIVGGSTVAWRRRRRHNAAAAKEGEDER